MGNLPEVIKMGGAHNALIKYARIYGPVFKIFFLQRMFVVVADPDVAHQMMYRLTNRPRFVNPVIHLLPGRHMVLDDNGLVLARDGFWRMLRNAWQPAFAPGSLRSYATLMQGCAQQLVSALSSSSANGASHATGDAAVTAVRSVEPVNGGHGSSGHVSASQEEGGQYVDIHDLFNGMTLEVVGTCAYGVRFDAMRRDGEAGIRAGDAMSGVGPRLQQACKDFFGTATIATGTKWALVYAFVPALKPLIAWLAQNFPDRPYVRMINARTTIMATSEALINDWRARHDAPTAKASQPSTGSPPTKPAGPQGRMEGVAPGSFLDLLLEAQQKAARTNSPDQMDNLTLTAQANTFILAGTETTGNTLSHAVYLLCTHPDKLERLLQEVDAHGRDTPIGPEDKFPYADAVINETLRLIPGAPSTTRFVDRPEGVEVCGYKVHHGDALLFPLIVMQRDPAVWPRAEDFLPERWLPEGQELAGRNPNAYAPFGAGSRQCIGFKFALQEARIALVSVYKRFTFKLQPGQVPLKMAAGLTLGPKHGLLVQAVPRS